MRGYNSYHGRMPGKKRAAIIVMLLILAAACLYLLANEFSIFENDGSVHIRFPWSAAEPETEQTPAPEDGDEPGDVDLVIEPPVDPLEKGARVAEVSATALRGGFDAVRADWTAGAYNAVCVPLKGSDGLLRYASRRADATLLANGALTAEQLATLTESDFYTIARLSCFHDTAYAKANMESAGLCQSSGYVWYDNRNTHWLDPGKSGARQYLAGLCTELAELGFDEILLDDFGYPTAGRLQRISYAAADKPASLRQFLSELQTALGERKICLSVLLDEETILQGENEVSGVRLADVLGAVSRVYVQTEDLRAVEDAVHAINKDVMVVALEDETGNTYHQL